MKKIFQGAFFALIYFGSALLLHAQTSENTLFDDQIVSEIQFWLPQDSLNRMMWNLENERYTAAMFVFNSAGQSDTVEMTGLRLRGNTSLGAQKKSFKASFNAFVPGREYQGVRKLNLIGMHNDPTLVRQKLYYDVWNKAGLTGRRVNFVRLYINGEYRGLYTNAEEMDKQWLKRHYDDADGNLYKCTWPANLAYLGPQQAPYKALMNNPEERAYDLKTNEEEDDYSRLVALSSALNQPNDANFAANISSILEVNAVLKAFAIDVATGNWDDYFYNKNNYYLYDNPATGRFDFISYDTDNTFGVDWLNKDWATRDCLDWYNHNDPRPLATKLLAVPAFHSQFVYYLDSITRYITLPDSIFPHIDDLHNLVASAANNDIYRTLDYGYTIGSFHNGFTQTIDGHTPYGIKPFLQVRAAHTLDQISGLISLSGDKSEASGLMLSPNPVRDRLLLAITRPLSDQVFIRITDMAGREPNGLSIQEVNESSYLITGWESVPSGCYWVQVLTAQGNFGSRVMVVGE